MHPGWRHVLKRVANALSLIVATPAAATCWLETRTTDRGEAMFGFWAQLFAMLPGRPGMYLRRAFYRLTLDACDPNCYIGFGAICSHRDVRIERDVYVGTYSLIGSAWLHERCLIGSRASLLSGGALHELGPDHRWTASDLGRLKQVQIGQDTWIGEAAVVFADVGPGALVAAGAVVSTAVAPGIVVAGNPARFVRSLSAPAPGPDPREQESRYGTVVT
jgi:carbonic anhydrase/acetyltransferase-like protein (isoleucine patch superfamily)